MRQPLRRRTLRDHQLAVGRRRRVGPGARQSLVRCLPQRGDACLHVRAVQDVARQNNGSRRQRRPQRQAVSHEARQRRLLLRCQHAGASAAAPTSTPTTAATTAATGTGTCRRAVSLGTELCGGGGLLLGHHQRRRGVQQAHL